jgi:hypothetical protein
MMPDGLYQVTYRLRSGEYLCAGFVVAGGAVVALAPSLSARMPYWVTIAQRIGD